MNLKFHKNQQGLTLISIVFILILIGFFTLLILKISPIYMNHGKVVNAIEALKNTDGVEDMSKSEILSILGKRFDMNYVDYVTPSDFKIVKQPGYVKIDLEYERVEPIMGNLSVLVEFHEGFEKGSDE